jgi:HK97 family phage prohead protease
VEVVGKMNTEIKQMTMPVKDLSLDEALGTGSGYLATFGNVDKQKDLIVKGAFSKSIAALEADRKQRGGYYLLPLLWQHDLLNPIGGITLLREDSHGLYIEFELDMQTELGRRAYSALKKQYVGGFSIGYRTINSDMRKDGIRLLLELNLIEGSVVTFPANDQATPLVGIMKRDLSFEEEAGGLIATMKDVIRRYRTDKDDEKMTDRDDRYYPMPPLMAFTTQPLTDALDESREGFERDLRRCRREDDPILGRLDPNGKEHKREVAKRLKEREEKQRKQREALEAERKAQAEKQAAMSKDAYTPEAWAAASGYDPAWVRGWFAAWVNSGRVTPIDADKLVLSRGDISRMASHDFEQIEFQARKAQHRIDQERAA